MQHTVEEISPVKKKVAVVVSADEVDAVLNRAVAQYRSRVALPGFRKGKAPMAMIEKRFAEDIYSDAANELAHGSINDILQEMAVEPLGDISLEANTEPLQRGTSFAFTFSFETMPEMTLPEYEGIGVTEMMNMVMGNQTMDTGMWQETVFTNPTVGVDVAVQATLTLVIAGTLAGIFPAWKAVNISPIEALRAD